MTDRPRTAVIGAGISGLTAGKMLNDYDVPYTTFETSDRIGGNWAFGNPNGHSSAYRSLHIDTSKHRLSFKDFPIPDNYPAFPHHSDIKAYLDAYADAFGLLEHIEFNNGVVHARRNDGGGWQIDDQVGNTREFEIVKSGIKAPLSAAGTGRRLRSVRSGRLDSQVGGAGEGRSPALSVRPFRRMARPRLVRQGRRPPTCLHRKIVGAQRFLS
jgi:Flavin-binding monooxygenase-like